MESWDDFEAEYQDLASDVSNANSTTYEQKLADFISLLDQSYWSKDAIQKLGEGIDFAAWYGDTKETRSSMAGSGELDWARDRTVRLGQQLALFRHFAEKPDAFSDFSINFMYVGSRYDDMVYEINRQLFDPFSRDLLKHIRKMAPLETKSALIPASDRVVAIDHNTPAYRNLADSLDTIEQAASGSNELAMQHPEERERIVAELGAARRLLTAARARVDAVISVLVPALKWLSAMVRDTAVQIAITAAIAALAMLLGVPIPGL